jgi:hypothetical protein
LGNLQIEMMDYNKTRTEAEAKKQTLIARLKEIPLAKKRLDEEAEQIKRELIGIDQILDGLAFMDSSLPPDFEPSGFTDNIRKILSETTVPLLPTQIRDALEMKGITGSTSKNLLINVHKVLERIESELDKTTREGKTAYKRKDPWLAAISAVDSSITEGGLLAAARRRRHSSLYDTLLTIGEESPNTQHPPRRSNIGQRIAEAGKNK